MYEAKAALVVAKEVVYDLAYGRSAAGGAYRQRRRTAGVRCVRSGRSLSAA